MSATLLCWMLLIAVSISGAQKTHKGIQDIQPPFEECGRYPVTPDKPMNDIDLRNSLRFAFLPTHPEFRMEFFVGEFYYLVTVEQNAITMSKCEGQDQSHGSCNAVSKIDEANMISTSSWNVVDILLEQNQLTVRFDRGEVTANAPSATAFRKTGHVPKVNFPAQYEVQLSFPCDTTGPPDQHPYNPGPTEPPRTNFPVSQIPHCNGINVTYPNTHTITVSASHTFAVYPSESMLILRITIDHSLYKAVVEGTTVDLQECDLDGKKCQKINLGGTKAKQLLQPYQWNTVEVLFYNGEITITINKNDNVMGKTMSTHGYEGPFQVAFLAGEPEKSTTMRPEYYVLVGEDCNVPVTRAVTSAPGVSEYISDAPTTAPSETGAPVGIIVGVLVALLIIIAIVIAVTIVKKRRTMQVTQHTPLQEQRAH